MVVDSSALVAVVRGEIESDRFRRAMRNAFPRLVAAPTAVEASVVILSRFGESGLADLDALMAETGIEIVPFAGDHVRLAIDAFRQFGKGRHPAGLNFGDCFSYALAKATDEPLLFKGDDFSGPISGGLYSHARKYLRGRLKRHKEHGRGRHGFSWGHIFGKLGVLRLTRDRPVATAVGRA